MSLSCQGGRITNLQHRLLPIHQNHLGIGSHDRNACWNPRMAQFFPFVSKNLGKMTFSWGRNPKSSRFFPFTERVHTIWQERASRGRARRKGRRENAPRPGRMRHSSCRGRRSIAGHKSARKQLYLWMPSGALLEIQIIIIFGHIWDVSFRRYVDF